MDDYLIISYAHRKDFGPSKVVFWSDGAMGYTDNIMLAGRFNRTWLVGMNIRIVNKLEDINKYENVAISEDLFYRLLLNQVKL